MFEQQRKAVATTQAKASTHNSKMDVYCFKAGQERELDGEGGH